MENTTTSLIENVLKQDGQDIEFEPIPDETDSPLDQPVVQKSNTSGDVSAARHQEQAADSQEQSAESATKATETSQQTQEPFNDAPEQEINAGPTGQEKQDMSGEEAEEFSMPLEHARMMADSIIGTINNTVLEVGGGYFITIHKHKDFYDFEEIIQVIDEQNVKNIRRLKLDEEDKALLRPLLVHVLRKKAAVMSPEKQLLMVTFSILIKKAKVVMEIRSENAALVERIRDVIRKEVRAAKEEQEEQQQKPYTDDPPLTMPDEELRTGTAYEEVTDSRHLQSNTGLPDQVLERY